MNPKYNPKILQKEVERLYNLATFTIIVSALVFFIIGAIITLFLKLYYIFYKLPQPHYLSVVIYIILILIGLGIGFERSFRLRLEAQKTICIMSIKNDTELILNFLTDTDKDKKDELTGYNRDDKFVLESGIKEINKEIDNI